MTLQPNLPPLPSPHSMNWFSWLSRTSLDPVLVYEYGLVLTRNQLLAEDISYFDHEFLWSMGITVAKHRLEILKLARNETGRAAAGTTTRPLSGLITAISRTKKSFRKYIAKMVYHEKAGDRVRDFSKDHPGNLPGKHKDEIMVFEKRGSNLASSGPLVDSRVQDRLLLTKPRSPMWSGPLYPPKSPPLPGHLYRIGSPRLPFPGRRSPSVSGPQDRKAPSPSQKVVCGGCLDDYDEHSLWAQLFHDMKPT